MIAWEARPERIDALQDVYNRYDVEDRCLETYKRNVAIRDIIRQMIVEVE